MKRLSIDDIKNLPDVPSKVLEIPEWKVSLEVQGISKGVQIELGRIVNDPDKDAFDYQRALLKVCVIDPILSDEDIDELYKKDSNIVDKIFVEINDLNGVGGIADSGDEFQE